MIREENEKKNVEYQNAYIVFGNRMNREVENTKRKDAHEPCNTREI